MNLDTQLREIFSTATNQKDEIELFLHRLEEGNLTRATNPQSHFCAYFAAFDPTAKQFFIGHHRKSNLWLFNGGHIDPDETLEECVKREMSEEWGKNCIYKIPAPELFTLTRIENEQNLTCKKHYDIWHFIEVNKTDFYPDPKLLATEFHDMRWLTKAEALDLVIEANNLRAIDYLCQKFAW